MISMVKKKGITVALMVACLLLPHSLLAQEAVDDKPNGFAMAGDLVVARPIGLALTALGTAAWVVSLPFTLAAGHAGEAADQMVVGPAKATFVRCLGCRNSGYTGKDTRAKREEAKGE